MKIDDIVNEIIKSGKRETDPMIIKATLLYYGAILLNRYSIRKDIRTLPKRINLYCLVFAVSGIGKSFILKIVENLCDLELYAKQRRTVYEYITELSECESDEQILKFLQGNAYSLGVSGTKEGLFEYAKAYSASKFGSINIQSDEIGDNINGSSDLLNQLKQMYDGNLQKKIIKGGEDDTPDDDIHNIICNFYGTGSKSAIDSKDRKKLTGLVKSGMFRRSICIDSKLQVKKKAMEEVNYEPIHQWFIDLNVKHKELLSKRLEKYGMIGTLDTFIEFNSEAINKIDKIDTLLVQRADKDKISDLKQIDTGSLDMIVNIACIVSFIEDSEKVTVEHLEEAYKFFLETRETVEKTFDDVHAHDEAYRVLKMKGSLTHSEIMDISGLGIIPRGKNQWKDVIELVHELCYRNGEYLRESTGRVSRYTIEPLPETELSKLIFSISTDDRGAKAIAFNPVELEWDDIEYLVKSSKVDSFTTSHFNPSNHTGDYGHRKADNHIQGQNVIAFDIDNGLTIEKARQLFSSFTYCIYTTKSHQTEKGNYCDRFRIILPTKHKFFVTPEQHKEMIINAETVLGLKNNDIQTRNVSRLWFTNPNADEVITNDGELFDISGMIPDTNKSDKFLPKLKEFLKTTNNITSEEHNEIEDRINGMMKYSASIVAVGNLDGTLFNLGALIIDLQYSEWERKMYEFTNIIGSPIKFTDRVISSLKSKYKI